LTDEEKVTACKLIMDVATNYVKTATGFNGGASRIGTSNAVKIIMGEHIDSGF
jgi:deoxyribose-phosphate aldolase